MTLSSSLVIVNGSVSVCKSVACGRVGALFPASEKSAESIYANRGTSSCDELCGFLVGCRRRNPKRFFDAFELSPSDDSNDFVRSMFFIFLDFVAGGGFEK